MYLSGSKIPYQLPWYPEGNKFKIEDKSMVILMNNDTFTSNGSAAD